MSGEPVLSTTFIQHLVDAGVVPENTAKVTIVAEPDTILWMEIEAHPPGDEVSEALQGYVFTQGG